MPAIRTPRRPRALTGAGCTCASCRRGVAAYNAPGADMPESVITVRRMRHHPPAPTPEPLMSDALYRLILQHVREDGGRARLRRSPDHVNQLVLMPALGRAWDLRVGQYSPNGAWTLWFNEDDGCEQSLQTTDRLVAQVVAGAVRALCDRHLPDADEHRDFHDMTATNGVTCPFCTDPHAAYHAQAPLGLAFRAACTRCAREIRSSEGG